MLSGLSRNLIHCRQLFGESLKIAACKRNIRAIASMQDVKSGLIQWMGIERGYQPLQENREYLLEYLPNSQEELPVRTMQDSFSEAIIPLSTDILLQDKYVTFLGYLRLGRLMEDMDMFAVWVTSRHILNPKQPEGKPSPFVLVTVLVDKVDFTQFTPVHNADIRLSGHVSWVGKSSIETVVWLEQQKDGAWVRLTRALFIMVARNSTNTASAFVNRLEATSERDTKILAGGAERQQNRIKKQRQSLLKVLPNAAEQQMIHDIFVQTVDVKDPTFHKRILPVRCEWMKDARWSTIIFCHPEDRNLHNKIFGGFLMRQALELSWTAGYLYSKFRPRLCHISDIGFHHPVEVGSLLRMNAHVTYTQDQYVQVLVHAQVVDHYGEEHTTNNFYYTYEMPERVKKIIPRSYNDAMLYIDGRRQFEDVMGLKKQ